MAARFKVGDVVTLFTKGKHPIYVSPAMISQDGSVKIIKSIEKGYDPKDWNDRKQKLADGYFYAFEGSMWTYTSTMFAETYEY